MGSIEVLDWPSILKRIAKKAVLRKSFDLNTSESGEIKSTFIVYLMATFRIYNTFEDIVDVLIERFVNNRDNPERLKVEKLNLIRILSSLIDNIDQKSYKKLFNTIQIEIPSLMLEEECESFRKCWNKVSFSIDNLLGTENIDIRTISMHEFLNFSKKVIAEQITLIDKQIFASLQLYQCCAAIWNKQQDVHSVRESINQFNRVSHLVLTSLLLEPGTTSVDRAEIVSLWINVAWELRILKNFASLNAIISALNLTCLKRLENTWANVSEPNMNIFEVLTDTISSDRNSILFRQLHDQEGTSNYAKLDDEGGRQRAYSQSCGTIPYLGIYQKDLIMYDSSSKILRYTADGLINCKYAEQNAKKLLILKQFQATLKFYKLQEMNPLFIKFYYTQFLINENQAYEIAGKLEPLEKLRQPELPAVIQERKTFPAREMLTVNVICNEMSKSCALDLQANDTSTLLRAMDKLGLGEDVSLYSLFMVTNSQKFLLPPHINAFYSIDRKAKTSFIVKLNQN